MDPNRLKVLVTFLIGRPVIYAVMITPAQSAITPVIGR
jgi:hypothetical protein